LGLNPVPFKFGGSLGKKSMKGGRGEFRGHFPGGLDGVGGTGGAGGLPKKKIWAPCYGRPSGGDWLFLGKGGKNEKRKRGKKTGKKKISLCFPRSHKTPGPQKPPTPGGIGPGGQKKKQLRKTNPPPPHGGIASKRFTGRLTRVFPGCSSRGPRKNGEGGGGGPAGGLYGKEILGVGGMGGSGPHRENHASFAGKQKRCTLQTYGGWEGGQKTGRSYKLSGPVGRANSPRGGIGGGGTKTWAKGEGLGDPRPPIFSKCECCLVFFGAGGLFFSSGRPKGGGIGDPPQFCWGKNKKKKGGMKGGGNPGPLPLAPQGAPISGFICSTQKNSGDSTG